MTLALVDNLPQGPATLAIGLAPIRVTGKPCARREPAQRSRAARAQQTARAAQPQVLRPPGAADRRHPRHLRLRRLVPARTRLERRAVGHPHRLRDALLPLGRHGAHPARQAPQRPVRARQGRHAVPQVRRLQLRHARGGPEARPRPRLRRGLLRPAAQRVGRRPRPGTASCRPTASVRRSSRGATTCPTCTSSATSSSPTRTSPTSSTCSRRRASSGSPRWRARSPRPCPSRPSRSRSADRPARRRALLRHPRRLTDQRREPRQYSRDHVIGTEQKCLDPHDLTSRFTTRSARTAPWTGSPRGRSTAKGPLASLTGQTTANPVLAVGRRREDQRRSCRQPCRPHPAG